MINCDLLLFGNEMIPQLREPGRCIYEVIPRKEASSTRWSPDGKIIAYMGGVFEHETDADDKVVSNLGMEIIKGRRALIQSDPCCVACRQAAYCLLLNLVGK